MKKTARKYPPPTTGAMMLREAAVALEEKEWVVNVRAAKDQLSSLLEQAAAGNEVIITSDGQPKAKLVPVRAARPAFRVDWRLLESMPAAPAGPAAEELIRADRDDRP